MKNQLYFYLLSISFIFFISSCNKKTIPTVNTYPAKNVAPISATEYKKEKARKGTTSPPKVIVVSDAVAKHTLDGKYYYEINGYRYWKNNKDGKYYLNGIFSAKEKQKNK